MIDISPVPEKLLVSPMGTVSQNDTAAGIETATADQDLRKACADFESLFLYKLMQIMRKTVPESGLFDRGLSHDIYTDLLDEKTADMAARAGHGTGFGERLYMDIMRHKGVETPPEDDSLLPSEIVEGYVL